MRFFIVCSFSFKLTHPLLESLLIEADIN